MSVVNVFLHVLFAAIRMPRTIFIWAIVPSRFGAPSIVRSESPAGHRLSTDVTSSGWKRGWRSYMNKFDMVVESFLRFESVCAATAVQVQSLFMFIHSVFLQFIASKKLGIA